MFNLERYNVYLGQTKIADNVPRNVANELFKTYKAKGITLIMLPQWAYSEIV